MMVREEEAITKWCPHARTLDTEMKGVSANRDVSTGLADPLCLCLGADCMAWRWGSPPPQKTSPTPVEGWEHCPADEAGEWQEYWLEPQGQAAKRRLGWCGLAGRVDYA